ncbi:MAG TPA: tyrosinase family protein [Actinopolymorphaceae bacterium]|jgi:tyrosinase
MLTSQLFAGDALLEAIAADGPERISTTQNASSPSVGKVQQALLTWDPAALPRFGADSIYGSETEAAVHRFKVTELGVDESSVVDDVGPQTVVRLDEIQAAAENPEPPTPPTPPPSVFTRQSVYALQPEGAPLHPIIRAYARAVEVLKGNAGAAPQLTWDHHTQVHGMNPDPGDGLRNQCQHATWYFLPWHRMEIFWFESVCRSIIAGLPDIDDETRRTWALPYWNYDQDGSRAIPPAFRDPTFEGRANPLFESNRGPGINAATTEMPSTITTAAGWFPVTDFSVTDRARPSFGGFQTGFHHPIGGFPFGQLEGGPHNSVHSRIGGRMNDSNQAAGDPIFWLHHANIDRLWEVWRANTGVGHDAAETAYLRQTFTFLAPDGTRTPHTPAGVVTTDTQLQYVYDDTSVPASAGVVTTRGGGALNENPSQTIGSMQSGMAMVSGHPADVSIALDPVGALDDVVNASRLVLMIEHVTAAAQVDTNFGVFVQPSDGSEGVMAGVLPMFGVHEASEDDAEHGLAFVFDVTNVVMRLSQLDQWDPSLLSLQIRSLADDTDAVEQEWPDVNIGSISMMIA